MPRAGRELEKIVSVLERIIGSGDIQIKSPDYIRGKLSGSLREVDVSLRSSVGSARVLAILECRDRQETQDVTWIEQLGGKKEDVGADVAIAVSSSQFSSGAQQMAKRKAVQLRNIENLKRVEIASWMNMEEVTFWRRVSNPLEIKYELEPLSNKDGHHSGKDLSQWRDSLKKEAAGDTPLLETAEGKIVTLRHIWHGIPQVDIESLFQDIPSDGTHVVKKIRVGLPTDLSFFVPELPRRARPVALLITAELWLDRRQVPLQAVKQYSDSETVLAQSAHFGLEEEGTQISFGIHDLPTKEQRHLSINIPRGSSEVFGSIRVEFNLPEEPPEKSESD